MAQDFDPSDYRPARIRVEHEVSWRDLGPLLDDLQQESGFGGLTVERWGFRPAAGGPGFDIVPILFSVAVTALVVEAVRDVIYPKFKKVIYGIYEKLPGVTPTGKVYPFGISVSWRGLESEYRVPAELSDVAFGEAVTSIPAHFATIRGRGAVTVVLTYDPSTKNWIENVEASEFRTWNRTKLEETPSGDDTSAT
jgi:hypothetical protein